MRTGQILALMGCLLLVGGALRADTPPAPKAWEVPGTKVGDEITGPDGGKMVWVPAGEFMMGSNETTEFFADMAPAHKVKLTQGFWLGKCEITTAQWQQYLKDAGTQNWPGSDQPTPGPDYPAWKISWDDATAYCKRYGLRLPTEAQWEYAAAGPDSRKFPWGNEWDPTKCCNALNRGPAERTWPAGKFPQGAAWCGALDMAGSVWEWCQDWWAQDYYANSPAVDPTGPDSGRYRPLRGGSWDFKGDWCRCVVRHNYLPADRNFNNGFRVAYVPGGRAGRVGILAGRRRGDGDRGGALHQ